MTILVSDIKSGGGFVPVGSPAQFDDRERLINDGGVLYLRTGEVEPNFANYPNFPIKYYNTGESFTPTASDNIIDMTLGGGFLWIAYQDNTLKNYNYDGTPAGVDFILSGTGIVEGIVYISGYIYAIHNATPPRVDKYDVATETNVDNFEIPSVRSSLATDGTYLYVGEWQYTTTGTLVDTIDFELPITLKLEYDVATDAFLNPTGGDYTFYYLNKSGEVISKENYPAWQPYPQTSITTYTKTTDDSLVFVSASNIVYIYQRGIFGGLSPEVNNTNAIGGSTVYWRIR